MKNTTVKAITGMMMAAAFATTFWQAGILTKAADFGMNDYQAAQYTYQCEQAAQQQVATDEWLAARDAQDKAQAEQDRKNSFEYEEAQMCKTTYDATQKTQKDVQGIINDFAAKYADMTKASNYEVQVNAAHTWYANGKTFTTVDSWKIVKVN